MRTKQTDTIFYNFSIFVLGRKMAFILSKSVNSQSCFMAIIFSILFIIGSSIDQTLIMKGKDTGLLEHPTSWCFIIIQIAAPFFLSRSIEKLFIFLDGNDVINSKKELASYITLFNKYTLRQTNLSVLSYRLLTLIGLICFVWNSFQNQAPMKYLGFDFWDSFNHPFGYWLTRVYKFYMWVLFFPAIIHIHFSGLFTLHTLLKDAEREKFFVLKPYNQDEYAGVGIIIKIAINPPIPLLLLGSVSVLAAFFIHGQIGITPIIGLSLMSLLFLLIYFIPAVRLRKIIKSEKKRQLSEITEKQNSLYFELVRSEKTMVNPDNLETLNSLTIVFDQVKSISAWPYWKSILKVVGFVNIPIVISIGKNLWPIMKAIFQR